MARFDDDDDWVGTPPEGRHSADRARPEFWWRQRSFRLVAAGIAAVLLLLLVIALVR